MGEFEFGGDPCRRGDEDLRGVAKCEGFVVAVGVAWTGLFGPEVEVDAGTMILFNGRVGSVTLFIPIHYFMTHVEGPGCLVMVCEAVVDSNVDHGENGAGIHSSRWR